MTDAAHAAEAATKGVLMILVPLNILLRLYRRGETLLQGLNLEQGRHDDEDDAVSKSSSSRNMAVTGGLASAGVEKAGRGDQTKTGDKEQKGKRKRTDKEQQQEQQQKNDIGSPFHLRDGQFQWIEGQVARAAGIQKRRLNTT